MRIKFVSISGEQANNILLEHQIIHDHILNNIAFSVADHMQMLCRNHFLTQVYRKIEGATIWSQNERNLDCVNTFQTNSILQRFMLRFDMLQLDCNDHLYIFDGAHATGTAKVSVLCWRYRQFMFHARIDIYSYNSHCVFNSMIYRAAIRNRRSALFSPKPISSHYNIGPMVGAPIQMDSN